MYSAAYLTFNYDRDALAVISFSVYQSACLDTEP